MQIDRTVSVAFSATGSTRAIVSRVAAGIASCEEEFDITRADAPRPRAFAPGEAVAIGVPSYGGRVPAPAAAKIAACSGNGALAVLVVSYGNRAVGDALAELAELAEAAGFVVTAAGAFVARHSLFGRVASGRPDASDKADIDAFARAVREKIERAATASALTRPAIPGTRPYRAFDGVPFSPEVAGACTACGRCARECPTGAIPEENPAFTDAERCIACMRCVAVCPLAGRRITGWRFKAAGWAFSLACARRRGSLVFL